jgi:hypothetical protein
MYTECRRKRRSSYILHYTVSASFQVMLFNITSSHFATASEKLPKVA